MGCRCAGTSAQNTARTAATPGSNCTAEESSVEPQSLFHAESLGFLYDCVAERDIKKRYSAVPEENISAIVLAAWLQAGGDLTEFCVQVFFQQLSTLDARAKGVERPDPGLSPVVDHDLVQIVGNVARKRALWCRRG